MATSPRRAVITGLGVLTPIGSSPAALWEALRAGTSGIRPIQAFDASALPCQIAGELTDFVAKNLIEKSYRKSLNAMARTVQVGVVTAQLAMQDAGLAKGTVPPERVGVSFASVMGATEISDLARASKAASVGPGRPVDMEVWGRAGVPDVPPMWMLKYLPNMPACHTTILYDMQGPSNTIIPNEAAGVLAAGEAFRILRRGAADVMLVGGAESKINPLSLSRFNSFAPLTRRNDLGPAAVRPFDRDASGTCLGEAGAAFPLEELGHARKRGAAILGEVVGYAAGLDRGLTGDGLARVIRAALADAGIRPSDVDHVNAHGLGVPELDRFEARGIGSVFGRDVPVFAPLSRFGNTGAAAGMVELACSLLALKHGELPGTLNHENPDPGCPVAVHTGPPRKVAKPFAVKVAYTDLGQCGALVVRRWEE
ncbi:MAG: beta-ketoacyl-[acyl-carrier-protein] synthase family protein [Gemmataceae bacterium]|nr:beta-ketoacyl-[acyl-carrier-protein] synthase family protein [Gemmataceae bacterium]